jgi:hypothetical protein
VQPRARGYPEPSIFIEAVHGRVLLWTRQDSSDAKRARQDTLPLRLARQELWGASIARQ